MNGLDRRSLLQLGGAWALAATLPRRAPERKLGKSLMFYMCSDGKDVREKFEIIRRAGFEGVEMDSPSPIPVEEILAARDATGLAISGVVDSVHWRKTLGDPDAGVRAEGLAALETAIRDCKSLGGKSVLLVPGVVNERCAYDDVYRRSQEEIRKVLPLAAELQVKVAIENVWNDFLLSPLEAARYVDEFQSPWIGWHLDCGNLVNYGYPQQWVRVLGKRIVTLHLKDFSKTRRNDEGLWKGFDVPLGDGDVDWAAVMAALDETGFQGWASAEVKAGGAAHLVDVSQRIDRIFAAR